jgi:FKBP-type peptidyl-prolyl cis-trans isomerase FkpA
VEQMGTGTKPTKDDTVKINYRGTLLNGREFDSSYKNGAPMDVPGGQASYPVGWRRCS